MALKIGEKGFYPGKRSGKAARAQIIAAAGGKKSAQIGWPERLEIGDIDGSAEVTGQKRHELIDVPTVGFQRLGREAPDGCKLTPPAGNVVAQGIGNGKAGIGHDVMVPAIGYQSANWGWSNRI